MYIEYTRKKAEMYSCQKHYQLRLCLVFKYIRLTKVEMHQENNKILSITNVLKSFRHDIFNKIQWKSNDVGILQSSNTELEQ